MLLRKLFRRTSRNTTSTDFGGKDEKVFENSFEHQRMA
jgi:hypothetical protein